MEQEASKYSIQLLHIFVLFCPFTAKAIKSIKEIVWPSPPHPISPAGQQSLNILTNKILSARVRKNREHFEIVALSPRQCLFSLILFTGEPSLHFNGQTK